MIQTRPIVDGSLVYSLLYGAFSGRRFTQDSPVLPEVWLELARDPAAQVGTLSVPRKDLQAHELAEDLYHRLRKYREEAEGERNPSNVSDIPGVVGAHLYLDEIVAVVLPMTRWWNTHDLERLAKLHLSASDDEIRELEIEFTDFFKALEDQELKAKEPLGPGARRKFTPEAARLPIGDDRKGRSAYANVSTLRLITLLAILELARKGQIVRKIDDDGEPEPINSMIGIDHRDLWSATRDILRLASCCMIHKEENGRSDGRRKPTIFTVSLNRDATGSNIDSVRTTKADAAKRLFNISCSRLAWAIIDSGINANHHAFRHCSPEKRASLAASWDEDWCEPIKREADSRVAARFDLSYVYQLRNRDVMFDPEKRRELAAEIHQRCRSKDLAAIEHYCEQMAEDLGRARATDWALVEKLVAVAFDRPNEIDHGTHVAGIVGGAWPDEDDYGDVAWVEGMCPDIKLYDFKVTGSTSEATEYAVIAAMRLIRHMNERNDYFVIHGANVSLSIPHDVTNYACGRTPVCDEAEKLHKSGVVVVAAAGNEGYNEFETRRGVKSLHTTTSITDPGNAQDVITVGSTHRREPHNYGVSYFSSRGPTGDGRMKPDLVAPGEKILGPVGQGEFAILEGTSMAAPHVSGAAAMLMSRYPELVGQPDRIKKVICEAATDVGRERAFQGHGVLDILRALQSV